MATAKRCRAARTIDHSLARTRFSFRAIDRNSLDHREFIQKAFFHGCGQVVWENIFGWWNPWPAADRALLRHCVWLLRTYAAAFQDPTWQPYVATHVEGVYAHCWHAGDTTIHTLLNESGGSVDAPVLTVPATTADGRNLRHYDVWQGRKFSGGSFSGRDPARCTCGFPSAHPFAATR
ncbi:hypothetical protein KFU94_49495 [Chloroflexi bacterium TSY]|nr:hypothetical protein [Chloroflexi bacterium TSY]